MEWLSYLPSIFQCVGLILDILGIIILFKWEPPISGFTKDGNIAIVTEMVEEFEPQFNKNNKYSKRALVLLIVGFIFQFIATIFIFFK
jgi:hypothetical protein